MWVLYGIADIIFVFVYHLSGYRKKIVLSNLANAFPEKSAREREQIARKFYHNFIDTFLEMIKMLSASDAFFRKRVSGNYEVINAFYASGRSCQLHLGHTFNWEWANLESARNLQYTFLGVYMPLSSRIMDRLFLKLRARSGTVLLPATDMRRAMIPWRNKQYALGLVADQAPGSPEKSFWLNFLHQPTPFVTGPETGARLNNLPVFFVNIEKPKRGYYKLVFTLATDNPASLPKGQLTLDYARYLEQCIRQAPDMWLWSHRRWKREWKEEYRELWVG